MSRTLSKRERKQTLVAAQLAAREGNHYTAARLFALVGVSYVAPMREESEAA